MIYYVIVPKNAVTTAMLNETEVLSVDKLRTSLNNTKVIFEIELPVPFHLKDYTVYTHEQCLEIVSGAEWQ